MSSDAGRKGTSARGGGSGPAAARRLGLLVFGAAFLVLFLIVAISEGVGDPSVPSGDVALVESVPSELGEVTQARFDHALELVSKQAGEKTVPKPGSAKYDELKQTALDGLFEVIWLQGEAEEEGISVTENEVARELKKLKKESFESEKEFNEFLKESGFTDADVNERVKLQLLSSQLQAQLLENAPRPSPEEIEDYYEAAKAQQFAEQPTRTIRSIVNKDRKKVEKALAQLKKDDSAKNWKRLAKMYSTDANTKEKGGLQEALSEGTIEEPLNAAVFNAPEGQVEGPVKGKFGYTIFEVETVTPEKVQSLEEVEGQIKATMTQAAEQEYLANFSFEFASRWTQRTFCAPGYVTERCANYKGDGHARSAPEACYEANPKGGRPEACPAPVKQPEPALPGSVNPLEPKGKPLPQRPRPKGEEGEEAAAGLEGLPPGAVPPTEGAPPPAE